jgi:putative redox protein
MQPVTVRSAGSFRNVIEVGPHRLIGDEPPEAGGGNGGPTPYDFLSAALGTCTSMTLHFYAKREKIPLAGVEVTITSDRMHAEDCADCLTSGGFIHRFDVKLRLQGDLTPDHRAKLLEVAKRCPVYKTLTAEIRIDETLVEE